MPSYLNKSPMHCYKMKEQEKKQEQAIVQGYTVPSLCEGGYAWPSAPPVTSGDGQGLGTS